MTLKIQIKVSENNKSRLEQMKIIQEESLNSVLTRVLDIHEINIMQKEILQNA